MTLADIHQLRGDLDGLPWSASVEIDVPRLTELLSLAESTLRRREDRTRPLRAGKDPT